MKRIVLLLILGLIATVGLAQNQPSTPPAQTPPAAAPAPPSERLLADLLGFMSGNWEGEGISRGEHEFIGKMSVTSELEGNALLIRRASMNKEGGPTGGLQEMMIIGFDGTTRKIVGTLYDNKNAIALYVGETKDNEIDFSLATATPGYISRRIFKLLPDGTLSFVVEGATPGKEVSKLVEISFKKKM
jgi:hypothetical protein